MGFAEHAKTIEKLARKHRQRVVVEIGLKYSTTVLLPRFKKYGARRHVGIDPVDRYRCPPEFRDMFEYLHGLSVEMLPKISDIDFVMIDGDHNYYTVTKELNLLHKLLKLGGVILLHDVEGPWSRKDFYYDRQRIPPEWLDGPKQGVLTAVEDFLANHTRNYTPLKIFSRHYTPLKIFSRHDGLGYFVRMRAHERYISLCNGVVIEAQRNK